MTDQENQAEISETANDVLATISEQRGWFIALGVVLVILGVVAIVFPYLTTLAAKIFVGWLFIIGGIVQSVQSFSCQRWGGFLYNLLIGILYVVVGVWLAFFPLAGIIALTVLLALTFMVEGVLEISMGIKHRPEDGWLWIAFSGGVSLAVGLLLFLGLPGTAAWGIGLLVGVNILSSGWSFIALALAADKK